MIDEAADFIEFNAFMDAKIKALNEVIDTTVKEALEYHAKGCEAPEDKKASCGEEFLSTFLAGLNAEVYQQATATRQYWLQIRKTPAQVWQSFLN